MRGESVWNNDAANDIPRGIQQVIGSVPRPEFSALLAEETERLLTSLENEKLCRLAELTLQDYTNEEIPVLFPCAL